MRRLPPLRSLEAFVRVAKLGSAKAAASELSLSPSRRQQCLPHGDPGSRDGDGQHQCGHGRHQRGERRIAPSPTPNVPRAAGPSRLNRFLVQEIAQVLGQIARRFVPRCRFLGHGLQ